MSLPHHVREFVASARWEFSETEGPASFVAVCPALAIHLCADSRAELDSLIPESIDSLLASLERHGDHEAFLRGAECRG